VQFTEVFAGLLDILNEKPGGLPYAKNKNLLYF